MNLRTQIASFEGRRHDAYLDTEGIWTIGIGHVDPSICKGLCWTDEQINAAFDADVNRAIVGCQKTWPWFADLNEPRQAALIGMVFQMGLEGVKAFKKMLGAVQDHRWADAEGQALDSKWAKQTPKRAALVARQLATGQWQTVV